MKILSKTNVLPSKSIIYLLFIWSINVSAHNHPIFPKIYKAFFCDACGCSNNGGSLGMGGVIENNFVGFRYLHQKYESKDGIFNNSPKIDEYFNTVQLWSRIPIINNLEVQVFVPFHFHQREYATGKTTEINGLGDVTLLSNYTILNKKKGSFTAKTNKISSTNHLLKVGAGIKLPTGKYNEIINNAINPSFQLGTGSIDYIGNLQYVYKHNNFGVTNYINYYLKTNNNKDYKFGDQFNFSSTLFHVFKDNNEHFFVPSVGISGEFYQENTKFDLPIKNTQGHALFSSLGIEYNAKKLTFGAVGIYPIQQNLAAGTIKAKYRTSLYLNYNF